MKYCTQSGTSASSKRHFCIPKAALSHPQSGTFTFPKRHFRNAILTVWLACFRVIRVDVLFFLFKKYGFSGVSGAWAYSYFGRFLLRTDSHWGKSALRPRELPYKNL